MNDLLRLSLIEIRNAIAEKRVSATEVTEAALDRIDEAKDLNAVLTVDREGALAAAKAADEKIGRGEYSAACLSS